MKVKKRKRKTLKEDKVDNNEEKIDWKVSEEEKKGEE